MTTVCWYMSRQLGIRVNKFFCLKLLGIPDGKFLEKRKYKNTRNNNEFFTPVDLIVGNDVTINSWTF